ncbi:MAG: endonuclease NucS [Solirubrobacteraceae bacterium]
MRLIVARCQVSYAGRLTTQLSEATRLLMLKPDGTFMVWADGGGPSVKPLNWMSAPTIVEEQRGEGELTRIVVRKRGGEDRLEIAIAEVLLDIEHQLDVQSALEKEGVERELQELLAARPERVAEGLRLVRREWQTDIGPVDLMCRDIEDEWVAVEIKRVATIDAVEQLSRYLQRICRDPAFGSCRGVLAAQRITPQARVLAQAREIACVEVDIDVLRGEREPELTLFAA